MSRTYQFPTAETVLNQAVSETIGSSTSSLTALQTTALLRRLNQINQEFINSSRDGWSWMEDVTNFETVADTTLNGAITTASTDVILTSATDFASSGRIWIKTSTGAIDFVDYTSKASNTLSGATDIDMSHASGEAVGKCHAIPSTYKNAIRLRLDETDYEYVKQTRLPVHATYYTRGAYLVLPEDVGSTDATLWFEKGPTEIAAVGTSLDIPTDYMWYAIHKLKAYVFRTRRKRQDALDCEEYARIELDHALNSDVRESSPTGLRQDY